MAIFNYWETGQEREKLQVRVGTEDEENLIDLLKELFSLGNVKSLNDTRWKVREWVKNKGYPLWLFKYAEKVNENTKMAIDNVFELIQSVDQEITYKKIEEYLHRLGNVKYDLNILIDGEDPKELFKNWINNLEGVDISLNDIEDVISYVRENMQEEVASWTEDKIREKVKDWEREKLKKEKENIEKEFINKINNPSSEAILTPVENERIISLKKKIEKCEEKILRDIMKKLLDENPQIAIFIERYLENY
jgi:hypothetical protein